MREGEWEREVGGVKEAPELEEAVLRPCRLEEDTALMSRKGRRRAGGSGAAVKWYSQRSARFNLARFLARRFQKIERRHRTEEAVY